MENNKTFFVGGKKVTMKGVVTRDKNKMHHLVRLKEYLMLKFELDELDALSRAIKQCSSVAIYKGNVIYLPIDPIERWDDCELLELCEYINNIGKRETTARAIFVNRSDDDPKKVDLRDKIVNVLKDNYIRRRERL